MKISKTKWNEWKYKNRRKTKKTKNANASGCIWIGEARGRMNKPSVISRSAAMANGHGFNVSWATANNRASAAECSKKDIQPCYRRCMDDPVLRCKIKTSSGKLLLIPKPSSSTIDDLIKAICEREKIEFSNDFRIVEDDGAELWCQDQVGHVIDPKKCFSFQTTAPLEYTLDLNLPFVGM